MGFVMRGGKVRIQYLAYLHCQWRILPVWWDLISGSYPSSGTKKEQPGEDGRVRQAEGGTHRTGAVPGRERLSHTQAVYRVFLHRPMVAARSRSGIS